MTRSSTSKKAPTLASVQAAFERNDFAPLYFLYGTEEYQKTALQESLIRHALQPHEKDFNFDLIYGAETDAPTVLGLCAGLPMMAERRLVIVRDFEKLADNAMFVSYAERPNPSAVVVLVCRGKPNMTTNPYRAIKSKAVGLEFADPRDRDMAAWITRHAERAGAPIEARAAQMLADVVGTDVQSAVHELDKLATFTGGKGRISPDDVIRASGQTREHNVFALQKAVGEADYPAALTIAERLLRQAPNPQGEGLKIVAILGAFVAKLWILSEWQGKGSDSRELADRVGIPSYYMQEYMRSLRYYRGAALEDAFSALLAADFELKGGSVRDPKLVLSLMLRRMVPGGL